MLSLTMKNVILCHNMEFELTWSAAACLDNDNLGLSPQVTASVPTELIHHITVEMQGFTIHSIDVVITASMTHQHKHKGIMRDVCLGLPLCLYSATYTLKTDGKLL